MGRLTDRYYDVTNKKWHWSIKSNSTNDGLVATPQDILDKLAHYEDLEEQGRLIELPCAVGDTVYRISEEDIKPYKVFSEPFACFVKNLWGKEFYATKEEAEAKLKELEG